MEIVTKIINTTSDFKKLSKQWIELSDRDKSCSMFTQFDWMFLWWQHYGRDIGILHIICAYQDSELVAILPLYFRTKDSSLMFLGTGEEQTSETASEYLDIICLPEYLDLVSKHFASEIQQKQSLNVQSFVIRNTLENSKIYSVVRLLKNDFWCNTKLAGLRYQTILPKTPDCFLNQLPKSFRKKMLRLERKLFSQLGGALTYADSEESRISHFKTLIKLHEKRWKNRKQQGTFNTDLFLNFHQKFSQTMLKKGKLRLTTLMANDLPLAIIYAVECDGTIYFYQSGIDDSFSPNVSPGHLIHFLMIKEAIKSNKYSYDFMKGSVDKSYKAYLSNTKTAMYDVILIKKSLGNLPQMIKWQLKKLRDVVNGTFVSSK